MVTPSGSIVSNIREQILCSPGINKSCILGSHLVHSVSPSFVRRLTLGLEVWLGPASTDSDLAIRLLCHLYSMVQFDTERQGLKLTSLGNAEPHWANLNAKLPWVKADIRAITRLVKRQWFTRLWVLQEALANPNTLVLCGTSETTWETLFSSIMCLLHKKIAKGWKQGALSRIVSISDAFRKAKYPQLMDAIHRARTLKCADPRDKVYAVLGIASNLGQVSPDYTLSEAEVYRQLAMDQMKYNDLNLLSYCDLDSRQVAGPTWVPDWSSAWTTQLMARNNAAGYIYASVIERLDDGIIEVAAVRAGTLCKVVEISIPSPDTRAIATEVARLAPAHVESRPYKTGCSLLEAFCGTLVTLDLNMLTKEFFNLTSNESVETVRTYLRYAEGVRLSAPSLEQRIYGDYLWGAVQNRAFISTYEGYIGLAPKHARKGDVVYAILSCRSLIVLRPVEGFETRFQVVGECFLYGLNHGEAVLGNLPEHIRKEYRFHYEGGFWYDGYCKVHNNEILAKDPRHQALGLSELGIYMEEDQVFDDEKTLKEAGLRIDRICLV